MRSAGSNASDVDVESSPHSIEHVTIPLHAEEITVSKRRRETLVRVAITTVTDDQDVAVDVEHSKIEIKRVSIDQVVDAVPPVRVEGETTIYPVVEEIVVVEKRLVLKEEVHVRRSSEKFTHHETVVVRTQRAETTRTPTDQARLITDNPQQRQETP